ncbi:MAG: hypothetical protein QOH61_1129 [Chloroflexota bacterium]|nr:hypothetical protein [Chloroflexota bacterium]
MLNFFPMRPTPRAHLVRVIARLGVRIGSGVHPGEPTIAWETGTWLPDWAVQKLPGDAINRRCVDISKSRVDTEWAAAAGYTVAVDPLTWEGPMIVKAERNGVHDGRLVMGPLKSRRPGRVYQRFVDAVEGNSVIELRTAVIAGSVPNVIRRWRQAADWDAKTIRSEVHTAEAMYSAAEIAQLIRFADGLGLEYGELDVLRDQQSGRIYVLDANRTPYGPPRKLPEHEAALAVERMAQAFSSLLERWS